MQVEEGQGIEITATAQTGYTFSKWNVTSGNESDVVSLTSATTIVTPTGNITIEATAGKQLATVADGNNLTGSANGTLNGQPATYQNPVIPVGFKTSSEGASWSLSADGTYVIGWNDGLVIEDAQTGGNQFVWVPVHNQAVIENGITIPAVPYTKWTSSKTGVVHSNCSDDTILSGTIDETTQITEYGGFYIARYEAGIPTSMTDAINIENIESLSDTKLKAKLKEVRNVSGTPVSKKGQIPWNYIDYTTSKANAERMYEIKNSKNELLVKSGLVTGTQWDTVMKWLENAPSSVNVQTDSRGWGNYSNSISPANVSGYGSLQNTGYSEYWKAKNIYDLAGNVWEWTNEIYSTDRVRRGGSYVSNGTKSPAAYRTDISVDSTDDFIGFRCVLYVQ